MGKFDRFRQIDDDMIWKGAALRQIGEFEALAGRLQIQCEVAGSHTSKSIELPVVRFRQDGNLFLLRDNFYDVNLCVATSKPVTLPLAGLLEGVCKPLGWDWYLGEVAKCRGYTWDYFTDEEMDDPRILRVVKPHKDGGRPMEWTVRRDEKDRWIRRMTDPSWFSKDWSSGQVCWDGEFGPDAQLFVQDHPFAEGIEGPSAMFEPYARGATMFGLALGSMEQAETIIRRVMENTADEENNQGW